MTGAGLDAILPLGDEQYQCGTAAEFAAYDASWGIPALKSITRPIPGNHEYGDSAGCTPSQAEPYYDYFGSAAGTAGEGWYSFDIGSNWHVIALNSQLCVRAGGCGPGTDQYAFLSNDLGATTERCILAYMHHPLFASGTGQDTAQVKPLWDLLYASRADVVLAGHKHIYERFKLQNPDGAAVSNGIRQFIVGTGGVERGAIGMPVETHSQRRNNAFGVLELTLRSASYEWEFQRDPTISSTFTDSGSRNCH